MDKIKYLIKFILIVILGLLASCMNTGQNDALTDVAADDEADNSSISLYEAIFFPSLKHLGELSSKELLEILEQGGYQVGVNQEIPFEAFVGMAAMEGYEIVNIVPTSLEQITVEDPHFPDRQVSLYFYSGARYLPVLTFLTYGNANYYVSAFDSFHSSETYYQSYAINREPPLKAAGTAGQLSAFLYEELPELEALYQSSLEGLAPFTVELSVEPVVEGNGSVTFYISTNLPLNMTLSVDLLSSDGRTVRKQVSNVGDGLVLMEQVTDDGNPLEGSYTLEISMPTARNQSADIRARIGYNGELLEGEHIGLSDVDGSKVIRAVFDYQF